jgi:hypothetical protein
MRKLSDWIARHKKLSIGLAAFVVLVIVVTATNHKSATNAATATTPTTTPAPAKKAAYVILLHKSKCFEDLSLAYIRCVVWVQNKGDAAGSIPDVNVLVRYSDGSSTIFTNTTDALNKASQPGGYPIPAHQGTLVLFAHSYDEQGHSLVEAATSLNLNANRYPTIRVASPEG